MSVQHTVDRLNAVLQILEQDVQYNGELRELTRNLFPAIPDALLNVLLHSNVMGHELFLGYDALSEQDVVGFYQDRGAPMSFFGAYRYQSDFLLTKDMAIALENTLAGELAEPEMIRDVSRLLPMFRFQSDYIVADLSEQRNGALLTVVYGHLASLLAPGIVEHVLDVRDGLEEGVYQVGEYGLIYPSAWYQRVGVRAGTMEMDEFGEVVES